LFVYEHTHSAERWLIKTDKTERSKRHWSWWNHRVTGTFCNCIEDTLNQAGILIERPTQTVCPKLHQLGSPQTDQNLSKKLCFFWWKFIRL